MSSFKELEELQQKRAKLEDESQALKEEQKKLEERARQLEEKIMEELKTNNKTARQAIAQLESMTNELEQKLKQVSQQSEASKSNEETSKNFLRKCASCGKDIPIASEECQYCGAKITKNPEQKTTAQSETDGTQPKDELAEVQEVFAVTASESTVTVQQQESDDAERRANEKKKGRFF